MQRQLPPTWVSCQRDKHAACTFRGHEQWLARGAAAVEGPKHILQGRRSGRVCSPFARAGGGTGGGNEQESAHQQTSSSPLLSPPPLLPLLLQRRGAMGSARRMSEAQVGSFRRRQAWTTGNSL